MLQARSRTRVGIGVPMYNGGAFLAEALESFLQQSYRDFVLVLVDDCSSDDTPKMAERYAALDERVVLRRNEHRLGMTANYRRAFEAARELCPELEYFAWGSDHDIWHPRWLDELVRTLDERPAAVLAFPYTVGISEDGITARLPRAFDTEGVTDPVERLKLSYDGMIAGDMVYGLFRADQLAACGVYRTQLLPDRLLLSELALHGEYVQVPEILWLRRLKQPIKATLKRQRRVFFPDGAPWYAYLSWAVVHPVVFSRSLWRTSAEGGPVSRGTVAWLGALFAWLGVRRRFRRAWGSLMRRLKPMRRMLRVGYVRKRLRGGLKRMRRFAARSALLRRAVQTVRGARGGSGGRREGERPPAQPQPRLGRPRPQGELPARPRERASARTAGEVEGKPSTME